MYSKKWVNENMPKCDQITFLPNIFLQVNKSAFSYFMVLRKFSKWAIFSSSSAFATNGRHFSAAASFSLWIVKFKSSSLWWFYHYAKLNFYIIHMQMNVCVYRRPMNNPNIHHFILKQYTKLFSFFYLHFILRYVNKLKNKIKYIESVWKLSSFFKVGIK